MTVYNAAPFVEQATHSILDQTLGDFEFIIVNDGSTDGSKAILERLAAEDDRIRLVHQANAGVSAAANRGLDMARGRYIARMDADDISHPERFEHQVAYLDAHPQIGVLGTQVQYVDRDGRPRDANWFLPTSPGLTAWRTLFRCCIANPTVTMRARLFSNSNVYDEDIKYGEDYDLWTRLVRHTQLTNLPDTLLKFRRWGENTTALHADEQETVSVDSAHRLHQTYMPDQIDPSILRFLTRQQHTYAEWAWEHGRYSEQILTAASAHVRALLRSFLDTHAWPADEVRRIKEDAYTKLSGIARVAGHEQSKLQEWSLKIRAHLLVPHHIPRWLLSGIRRRL